MVEVLIGKMEAGKRVHRYVRQLLPGVPLSGIHKMIRTDRVKVNGKRAKADDVLQIGDKVHLYMADEDFREVSKSKRKFAGIDANIEIVFEDENILVVNKPAGLLTHGNQEEQKDTLVNRVSAYLYQQGELQEQSFTPAPANRLDRNTSGLVIFGKTGAALRDLASRLADHKIDKWYLAIVKGEISSSGAVRVKLTRDDSQNRTYTAPSENGKSAETLYQPLESAGGTTIVQIKLIHGRTHQIRAHFQSIGHPLVGDVKYGGGRFSQKSGEHQWLHAFKLRLADGQEYSAPLPPEFQRELKQLGYSTAQIANLLQR